MSMVKYKNLHKIWKGKQHVIAHNVSCGLVKWNGHRFIGCGKRATSKEPNYGYWYRDKKYGTISSVYLCKKCKKKAGRK